MNGTVKLNRKHGPLSECAAEMRIKPGIQIALSLPLRMAEHASAPNSCEAAERKFTRQPKVNISKHKLFLIPVVVNIAGVESLSMIEQYSVDASRDPVVLFCHCRSRTVAKNLVSVWCLLRESTRENTENYRD